MRKLLLTLTALTVLTMPTMAGAKSPNSVSDYVKGIQEGIRIGIQFERDKLKQELKSVSEVAKESLNYKYYFLKGEVPPPLVMTRLVEKKGKDGYTILSTETEVLPPAFFPVSLFQDVRKEIIDDDVVVIPAGYVVVLDTENLPTDRIAYYKWLAKTSGYSPVYDYKEDKLFFVVRDREADAEADREFLSGIGIPNLEIGELKKPLVVNDKTITNDDELAKEIKTLARQILEKEKKVAGVKVSADSGLTAVVTYLQKALAAVQSLDPQRYDRLNLARLEQDLEQILSNLGEAVALQEKYDAVVIRPTTNKPSAVETAKVRKTPEFKPSPVRVMEVPPLDRLKKIKAMLEE